MSTFDPGPPALFLNLFDQLPTVYEEFKSHFWYDWGPVFYRGRLDGSARVLCIASDPGPTECIARRTLVGDSGQRVQGLLTKLGLTRSYLCLNAYAFALFPSHADQAEALLDHPQHRHWQNQLLNAAAGPSLEAIIVFGGQAEKAVNGWTGRPTTLPLFRLPHPASRNNTQLVAAWRNAVPDLRTVVTPDADGDNSGPNYGAGFKEIDYARIPSHDLPFGMPAYMGDDAWGRKAKPRHNNQVSRSGRNKLIWMAPKS